MKSFYSYILIFLILWLPAIFSCRDSIIESSKEKIDGGVISYTDCKQNKSAVTFNGSTQVCAVYNYFPETKKLELKHINAGFNCCPGEISCIIIQLNDTIIISEKEESPLCNCNCLFDLEIELSSVVADEYVIKFVEPYGGEQAKLIFHINLKSKREGEYCVYRSFYPWGQ